MTIRLLPGMLLISLLSACAPSRPQIPLPEVPAGPLAQAIAQRREAFQSLRAVAKVRIERQGRTRVYESVAFVQKGQDRLRIEGFGVLGDSLFTVLWDGYDVQMASANDGDVHRMGPAGFERLLGVSLSPADLCAVLTGNGPPVPPDAETRAGCRNDGRCVVAFRSGDAWRLVTLVPPLPEQAGDAVIESAEAYQGGALVFRGRFASAERIGGYLFPRHVVIENPGRKIAVTIQFEDIDVNGPVGDGAFVLSGGDGR